MRGCLGLGGGLGHIGFLLILLHLEHDSADEDDGNDHTCDDASNRPAGDARGGTGCRGTSDRLDSGRSQASICVLGLKLV